MRAHRDRAEGVAVLVRRFPIKIDSFARDCLAESALNLDDLAKARFRDLIVPEVTEVSPAAAWSVRGINYSPTFLAVPNPHGANSAHVSQHINAASRTRAHSPVREGVGFLRGYPYRKK
jgi:hypothetical protein